MGDKSCAWIVGMQLGIRAKTLEEGWEGRKGLGLMDAWRGLGWYPDKGRQA
jgi:hypothetical protein